MTLFLMTTFLTTTFLALTATFFWTLLAFLAFMILIITLGLVLVLRTFFMVNFLATATFLEALETAIAFLATLRATLHFFDSLQQSSGFLWGFLDFHLEGSDLSGDFSKSLSLLGDNVVPM